MQSFTYLGLLLFSLSGLAFADYRYKLAVFKKTRHALKTLGTAIAFFIVWDIAGIGLGIFFSGGSKYELGLYLLPEFPVEELFFLALLSYSGLLSYIILERLWQHT